MTRDEAIDVIEQELKGLSSKVVYDDYNNAVSDALRELGWVLPNTDDFQILWIKNRSKRYLFFMLMTEASSKFKFEQINSQQKFDHYQSLVNEMDKEFERVKKEMPHKFAGVSAVHLFGTKIDAGFASDSLGNDVTYEAENVLVITPSDSD